MGQKSSRQQNVKKGGQYVKQNNFYIKTMIKDNKAISIYEQYTFNEKIGSGTYAEVFKAKCNRSKQVCAIKKVDKKKVLGIEMILQNEFEILRNLDHPNIVKIIEMFQDKTHIYIVSEYIKGKQLFDHFKEKKILTEKQTYSIFYQTILAVNYLHTANIIHRDIKLQNIIYDQKSNILKLIDFGSAYSFDTRQPIALKCIGTVSYISPQVINKVYNYKCDNWSLGVFFYLLLTGKWPFEGTSKEETFKNIIQKPLQLNIPQFDKISKEAKDLLAGLLQKDLKKRFQLKNVLNHPWITKFKKHEAFSLEDQAFLIVVLKRLINFSTLKINKMQLAVLVFMINFVVQLEQSQRLNYCFHSIDFQGDGVITQSQLVQSLIQYIDYPQKLSQKKASEIMKRIDFNQSNDISYSQFLVAAAELSKILTDLNLQRTFSLIDTDNSGTLQASELKNKLGDQYQMQYYHQLIAFFDEDKDGQISLSQFKNMMKMILK